MNSNPKNIITRRMYPFAVFFVVCPNGGGVTPPFCFQFRAAFSGKILKYPQDGHFSPYIHPYAISGALARLERS